MALFPLSRYKVTTFLLILLSALLIVGQNFLTDVNPFFLWGNWLSAGLLALGIWYLMGRFHLGGVSEGKSLAITWPLMSVTQNFALLYFDPSYSYIRGLLVLFALMGIITLALSTWQEEQSTIRSLSIGLLIGLSSTVFPHSILWLILVPFITFHMRSASSRNVFSILTGALMGVWMNYCLLFILLGEAAANAMLLQYADIINLSDYTAALSSFSLWQWLYLAMLTLLVIVYSISAMLLGTGHSVRASASIMLLSTVSIAEVLFLCFDLSNTALYISQLTLFLCVQLSIHQANLRSSVNEWWTICIILLVVAISILPLVYAF